MTYRSFGPMGSTTFCNDSTVRIQDSMSLSCLAIQSFLASSPQTQPSSIPSFVQMNPYLSSPDRVGFSFAHATFTLIQDRLNRKPGIA
jgi:hypothetical protein